MSTQKEFCPLVSIGVPAYNSHQYIAQALQSLLMQSYQNLEIFVSDDVSTDGTWEIIREFVAKDSRIKAIRQPKKLCMMPNFQYVFDETRGDYFMWAGDHDKWDPDFVTRCVQAFERRPDAVLIVPRSCWINTEGQVVREDSHQIDTSPARSAAERVLLLMQQMVRCNPIYGMYTRTILQEALPFPEVLSPDCVLIYRVAAAGNVYTEERTNWYRRITHHEQSSVQSYRRYVRVLPLHGIAALFPLLICRLYLLREFIRCHGTLSARWQLLQHGLRRFFLNAPQIKLLFHDTFLDKFPKSSKVNR